MSYIQGNLPGFVDDQPKKGEFPVFAVTNLETGEYAEICHQNSYLAASHFGWIVSDCDIAKIGRSNAYQRVFKRTRKRR